MKFSKILLLLGTVVLTQPIFANITIKGNSFFEAPKKNMCESLTGTWSGSGTAIAGALTCMYSGIIEVMPGNTPTAYIAKATLKSNTGGFCPPEKVIEMTGTCKDQELTLENSNTNLSGTISSDGTSADLSGYVYFNVLVKATLENVHLLKLDAAS